MVLILAQLLLQPLHRGVSLKVGHDFAVLSLVVEFTFVAVNSSLDGRSGSSVRSPSGCCSGAREASLVVFADPAVARGGSDVYALRASVR